MARIYPARFRIPTLLLACLLAPVAFAQQWQFDDVGRIVALSDVHGANDAMLRTLRNADVVDENGRWIAGDTHLVITGDLLDRGPDSRASMDFLMRLEGEAATAGGRVHVLIGNHEAMNLMGDMRYVSAGEYAAFAADETAAMRNRAFAAIQQRTPMEREAFDEKFPPGFFAHRAAFSANGRYGAWLLTKPLLIVINRTAFVHGGLSPLIADLGLDATNRELMRELSTYVRQVGVLEDAGVLLPTDSDYDHLELLRGFRATPDTAPAVITAVQSILALQDSHLDSIDGPLWYRGNAVCGQLIEQQRLDASLEAIGAERVVIGHTPTRVRKVLQRFDGRVIEIDTGMLRDYYGGMGHALIIIDDVIVTVSENSDDMRAVMQHPRRVGTRPGGFLSTKALEQLLQEGSITNVETDAQRRRVATISDGSRTVKAVFLERPSRGFYPDVAAYRLDRLLGLDLVPVAVEREVEGDKGTLQFLPERRIDETSRAASGRGGSASCPLPDQWAAMYVFDSLIFNRGRTFSRMLYSQDNWQLMLINHQNAFSTDEGRPRNLANLDLTLGEAWLSALSRLDEETLEVALDGVLDKRRRRALLKRRDQLLEDAAQ